LQINDGFQFSIPDVERITGDFHPQIFDCGRMHQMELGFCWAQFDVGVQNPIKDIPKVFIVLRFSEQGDH
jgi:hypothetical protein